MLMQVATRLTAATRDGDLVARLGGDEFAVLLPGASEADASAAIARLSSCLEAPLEVDGVPLALDLSAGVAVFPADGRQADSLLRQADADMYAAKAVKVTATSGEGSVTGPAPSTRPQHGRGRRPPQRKQVR